MALKLQLKFSKVQLAVTFVSCALFFGFHKKGTELCPTADTWANGLLPFILI